MSENNSKLDYTGVKNPYTYEFSLEEVDGGVIPGLVKAYDALKELESLRKNAVSNKSTSNEYTMPFHFYKSFILLGFIFYFIYLMAHDKWGIPIIPFDPEAPIEKVPGKGILYYAVNLPTGKNLIFYCIIIPIVLSVLVWLIGSIYCNAKSKIYLKKAQEYEAKMKEYYKENDSLYNFIPEKYRNSKDLGVMIDAFRERRVKCLADAFALANKNPRFYKGSDFESMYNE